MPYSLVAQYLCQRNKAQGTIEYLVLIGVIIVISLIVVGLLINQTSTGNQVVSNAGKISTLTSSISVTEMVIGLDGTGLLSIQNNVGEPITLSHLSSNGQNTSSYDKYISAGEKVLVDLNGLGTQCGCTNLGEKRTCKITIHYVLGNGLEKQVTQSIPIECIATAIPKNPNQVIYTRTSGANIVFSCIGDIPPNATLILDDNIGLTRNTTITLVDTNTSEKCEYLCNTGFQKIGNACRETCNDSLEFHSGTGTPQDPYTICNWNHLDNMKYHPESSYLLLRDLNEDTYGYDGIGNNWTPIGITFDESDKTYCGGEWLDGVYGYSYSNCEFTGTFDGNNHTIKGLTISFENPKRVGLFGKTNGATISNIGLININIEDTENGSEFVGGLIGNSYNSTINNAYTTGNIKGYNIVGGLIGYHLKGSINKSHSTANIRGNNWSTGGLVGTLGEVSIMEQTQINESYTTSNVIGGTRVGGLVGSQNNLAEINNSYANGSLTVFGDFGGGLVGLLNYNASITNSYSAVNLTESSNTEYFGGLVGKKIGLSSINDSFFDSTLIQAYTCGYSYWSYCPDSAKTTTQMKQQSTFTNWNFTNIWDINTSPASYPFLRRTLN